MIKHLYVCLYIVILILSLIPSASAMSCNKASQSSWLQKAESRLLSTDYKPLFTSDMDYIQSGRMVIETRDYPIVNMRTQIKDGKTEELVPASKKNRFLLDSNYLDLMELKQQVVINAGGIKNSLVKGREGVIKVQKKYEPQLYKASAQLLAEVSKELPANYPKVFSANKTELKRISDGKTWSIKNNTASENLKVLSEVLAEDLVFSVRGEDGLFYLAGGVLAFPSRWSFQALMGKSIKKIHDEVAEGTPLDGSNGGPSLSQIIEKELNEITETGKVTIRNNWFIGDDPVFSQPDYGSYVLPKKDKTTLSNVDERVFIRSEYETMSRLGKDVVLFSIHPYSFTLKQASAAKGFSHALLKAVRKRYSAEYDAIPYYDLLVKYLEKKVDTEQKKTDSSSPRTVAVVQFKKITEDHSFVRLEKPKGMQLSAGQPIRLELVVENGDSVSRIFSLSSSPTNKYIELAVGNSDSNFKQAFIKLRKGKKVVIEQVDGEMKFNDKKPAVMIATGIGITPFKSMIESVSDNKTSQPIRLIYGNRTEIPFYKNLEAAKINNHKLSVDYFLSKPGIKWAGNVGRVDKAILEKSVAESTKGTQFYIVGNPKMSGQTKEYLLELGVRAEDILTENFSGAPLLASAPRESTICFCKSVSKGQIEDAIDAGAKSVLDIAKMTTATTGCGQCKLNVNGVLECKNK